MKKEILRAEHLSKRFDGVRVLDDLSFSLYAGEVLGLAGLNHSGKTTLANVLSGRVPQDAGVIRLCGGAAHLPTPGAARRLGIYCINQQLDLMPELSVSENLSLFSDRSGRRFLIDQQADLAQSRALLEEMGLGFDPEAKCASLSAAQRHLLQIAKGVFLGCRVLILNNVTGAYSAGELELCFAALRLALGRGISVLFISQHPAQLFAISDRILVLRSGGFAGTLFPEDYSKERLTNLLVGRIHNDLFARRPAFAGEEVFRVDKLCCETFQNLTFSLRKGEILGLSDVINSDPFGLIRLLSGEEAILSGTVSLEGRPMARFTPESLLRRGIGVIAVRWAHSDLFPNLSVADNVNLLRLGRMKNALGFLRPRLERYAAAELRDTLPFSEEELSAKAGRLRLSREQELLILLERWRSVQPRVLFLADVFRDLDIVARRRIWLRLEELSCQGIAMVLISAEFSELLSLCDRVLVLENGCMLQK